MLGPQPPILSVMNTNWDSRSSDYTPHAATGADDAIMISSSQLDLEKKITKLTNEMKYNDPTIETNAEIGKEMEMNTLRYYFGPFRVKTSQNCGSTLNGLK